MNILLEIETDLRRSFNQSPLRYLNEFLEVKKGVITEAEYVEILTYIVEGMAEDMAKAGKTFGSEIEQNYAKIEKIKKSLPDSPKKTAILARLKGAIVDLNAKKAGVMKAIKAKYKGLYNAAKGSRVGKKVAEKGSNLKKTGIGKKIIAHPKIAAGVGAGGAVAAGLMAYASRRKKKAEAARKLGLATK